MNRLRLSFLPVFFLCLGTAFAAAVFVRIHDYRADLAARDGLAAGSAAESHAAREEARRRRAAEEALPPIDGVTSAETGTVIPVGETASPESIAAARAAREQRYRELLAAGAQSSQSQQSSGEETSTPEPENTGALTPQPQPKPESAISRLLRPIVNAVTGRQSSSSTSPTTPVTDTASRPENHPKDKPPQEKDPSSDTTPPQVMSIDFIPPTVHDGEETILGVVAIDDLSGVRTISGSIISPSGGLQGFALQREGETNRYTSRIMIPKDSPEGVWRINYLNLTDNAGNPLSLTYHGGGAPILANALFRVVSSSPDSTGPTLRRVWLEKAAIHAGERDIVYVQADDDKSGVHLVSGVFQSPQ